MIVQPSGLSFVSQKDQMFVDFVDVEILPNNLVCQTLFTSTK